MPLKRWSLTRVQTSSDKNSQACMYFSKPRTTKYPILLPQSVKAFSVISFCTTQKKKKKKERKKIQRRARRVITGLLEVVHPDIIIFRLLSPRPCSHARLDVLCWNWSSLLHLECIAFQWRGLPVPSLCTQSWAQEALHKAAEGNVVRLCLWLQSPAYSCEEQLAVVSIWLQFTRNCVPVVFGARLAPVWNHSLKPIHLKMYLVLYRTRMPCELP